MGKNSRTINGENKYEEDINKIVMIIEDMKGIKKLEKLIYNDDIIYYFENKEKIIKKFSYDNEKKMEMMKFLRSLRKNIRSKKNIQKKNKEKKMKENKEKEKKYKEKKKRQKEKKKRQKEKKKKKKKKKTLRHWYTQKNILQISIENI